MKSFIIIEYNTITIITFFFIIIMDKKNINSISGLL